MPLGSAQNQDQRHTDQIGRQSCQHDLCTSMKNTSTVSPDNPTVNPVIKVTPTLYIPSRTAKIPTQKSLAPSIFGMETGIVMMFFSVSWVDSLSISQLPIITSEIGKTSAYCPRQHSQTEWKNHSLDFGTPPPQSAGSHIAPTDRVQAPPAPPKVFGTGVA